jgi:hypothetical protein
VTSADGWGIRKTGYPKIAVVRPRTPAFTNP